MFNVQEEAQLGTVSMQMPIIGSVANLYVVPVDNHSLQLGKAQNALSKDSVTREYVFCLWCESICAYKH